METAAANSPELDRKMDARALAKTLGEREISLGLGRQGLAARIGHELNPAQITTWLQRGEIPESSAEVIRQWLENNPAGSIGIGRGGRYYDTVAAQQIRVALKVAAQGYISVLTGDSGAGKTVPLLAALANRADLVCVTALDGMGTKTLPMMIESKLGIERKHGTAADRFRGIVDHLAGDPRVICIDEAHHLQYPRNFNQLYWMCDLANQIRRGACGIFLIGIPNLAALIRKTRKIKIADGMGGETIHDAPVIEQFLSRVRWRGQLPTGFDADKAPSQIVDRLGPVSDAVSARILELCGPSLKKLSGRRIESLCDNIRWTRSPGAEITVELVNKAAAHTF